MGEMGSSFTNPAKVQTESYRPIQLPSVRAPQEPKIDKGIAAKQRNAVLVEGSILIHSVLIGFDLGLQTKNNWITLIIAISFHQFFEGFAVGQIVLDAQFGFWKKFAMISFYSLTTSVGICIGIGTYLGNGGDSGETQGVLITIGVIDAICGGLLLFAGMSVFWTEGYVNNHEHHISDSLLKPAIGFFWHRPRHGDHGCHRNLGLGPTLASPAGELVLRVVSFEIILERDCAFFVFVVVGNSFQSLS